MERGGPITHCPTFHPLPRPLSLVEYFFLEDYVASIRRLDRIEPPLPCFFFSFSFLPFSHFPSSNFFKSHASDSSVRKIGKFEINGMKVRDERFGEKFRRFDGGWMFRDLKFLERIGRSFVSLMLGAFAVGLLLPSVENIWKLTGLARVINIKYNRLIFISFILI